MSERLAIFAEGLFAKHTGKTAHGVIRYGTRDVVAVIDSTVAGRTANEVEPFCLHPAPIVATLEEAIERGADSLLIGVAPPGGKLDPAWRPVLLEAVKAGLSLEAGLHTQLPMIPSFVRQRSGRGCSCATCAWRQRTSRCRRAPTAARTRCAWCTAWAPTP